MVPSSHVHVKALTAILHHDSQLESELVSVDEYVVVGSHGSGSGCLLGKYLAPGAPATRILISADAPVDLKGAGHRETSHSNGELVRR